MNKSANSRAETSRRPPPADSQPPSSHIPRRRSPRLKPLLTVYNHIRDLLTLAWFAIFDRLALIGRKAAPDASAADLVIRLDAIGDYLMFRPFLAALKENARNQGKQLALCGNTSWRELAELFDSDTVDQFIWLDRKKFASSPGYRWRKLRELTATNYQTAINSTYSRDLFYADRVMNTVIAKEKIGSIGDPGIVGGWRRRIGDKAYTRLLPAQPEPIFEVYRNQEFVQTFLGYPVPLPKPPLPPPPAPCRHPLPERYGLLFMGASAGYKKWPLDCFARVGTHLQNKHGLEVILCGDKNDAETGAALAAEHKFISLIGETSLTDMLSIVDQAVIMISNETMPPHLAGLAGHPPCVVVSCSECFGRFFPYPQELAPDYRIVYHPEINADPERFKKESNLFNFYNTLDVGAIAPSEVVKVIDSLLSH